MQRTEHEVKLECSATAEDLTLSLTKDSLWQDKLNALSSTIDQESLKQQLDHIIQHNHGKTFSEFHSLVNSGMFDSFFNYNEEDEQNPFETSKKYKLMAKLSLAALSNGLKQASLEQSSQYDSIFPKEQDSFLSFKQDTGQQRKEGNQREPASQQNNQKYKNIIKDEAKLRTRLRQIDFQIRELSVEKNRLKYFLRKQKKDMQTIEEESFETRQCPCCGKLISKLCFRCEHLYCNAENCPRKKKQRLNAKMLEKMREKKKGGEGRKFRRSRNKILKIRQNSQKEGQEESLHSSDEEEEEQSNEINSSASNSFLQEDEPLRVYETRSKTKPIPDWKITMSDISLKESKLFVSVDQTDS